VIKSIKESGTHLLYPRFVQLFVEKQISKTKTHRGFHNAPKLVPKIFSYLEKDGKGFSGKVTPITPYMVQLVQSINQGEGSGTPTDSHHTPTFDSENPVFKRTSKLVHLSINLVICLMLASSL
jgi:hypothetical protein